MWIISRKADDQWIPTIWTKTCNISHHIGLHDFVCTPTSDSVRDVPSFYASFIGPIILYVPCYLISNNGIVKVTFSTTSKPQSYDFIGAFSPANTGRNSFLYITILHQTISPLAVDVTTYPRFQANGPREVRFMQHGCRLPNQGNGRPELQFYQSSLWHFLPLLHRNKSAWWEILPRHLRACTSRHFPKQCHVLSLKWTPQTPSGPCR